MDYIMEYKAEKLVLKFTRGSDNGVTHALDLVPGFSVQIGRDPECKINVNEKDGMVSRVHAEIRLGLTRDEGAKAEAGAQKSGILITNLSKNGLTINGKDVPLNQSESLKDEDIIQLGGVDGPQIEAGLLPKPAKQPAVTKEARAYRPAPTTEIPRPNVSQQPAAAGSGGSKEAPAGAGKPGIGAATLERRLDEVRKGVDEVAAEKVEAATAAANNKLLVFGASAAAAVLLVGGFAFYLSEQNKSRLKDEMIVVSQKAEDAKKKLEEIKSQQAADTGLATRIHQEWGDSTVLVEYQWQMVDANNNQPLYHYFKTSKGLSIDQPLPVYRELEDGSIQPIITEKSCGLLAGLLKELLDVDEKKNSAGCNYLLGGKGTGSGFVVGANGQIMTNKHVAAAWQSSFEFKFPGILVKKNKDGKLVEEFIEKAPNNLKECVPLGGSEKNSCLKNVNYAVGGRNSMLNVVFPGNQTRIPARLGPVSGQHDVAIISIDVDGLKPVDTNRTLEGVQAGDAVVQLGYPGISSMTYLAVLSQDGSVGSYNRTSIHDVSVTQGQISKLPRRIANSSVDAIALNTQGDSIELSIPHSGSGNSGGPVFDRNGRVIGLFTADVRNVSGSGALALVTPIYYGSVLLGKEKTIR